LLLTMKILILFAVVVVTCVSALPFFRQPFRDEILLNSPRGDLVNYTPNPLPCEIVVTMYCESSKNGVVETSATATMYLHDTYFRANTTEPGYNKIRLIRPDLQGEKSCAKFFQVETYRSPPDACKERCLSAEEVRTTIDDNLYDLTHTSQFLRKEDGEYQGKKVTLYRTDYPAFDRTFYVDSNNMLLACILYMGSGSDRTKYTYIYGYSYDVPFDIFVMDKKLSTKCDLASYTPPTKRTCPTN